VDQIPPDAVVVGAGPNGLAAAIVLAQAGRSVLVLEAAGEIGGSARTASLTLPGFRHDICSAVYPLGVISPFLRTLPLAEHGLEWIQPPAALAHPLDGGDAVLLERSLAETARGLGRDARAYADLMAPVVADWPKLESTILGGFTPLSHPFALARYGFRALRSLAGLAGSFRGEAARGLLAGAAAHSMLPLDQPLTAGMAMTLGGLAHIAGWPIPRGGAGSLSNALAALLRSLGGEIRTSCPVGSVDDLPAARAVLFDLSPKPLLRIAAHRLPVRYRRALERYRYGLAAFKVDWALDAPIPWGAPACGQAATVHLGGTLEEIARSEAEAWSGRPPERPFVILVQPSLFDHTRAPAGKHTAWGYCHVPNGCEADMLPLIEQQIERFAPGFRDRILARHVMAPADIERHNPNFSGGDIGSGVMDLIQFFARPTWRAHRMPVPGWYLCSAATPPGAGVHGMCGYRAARLALNERFL
jgi:phytoene dehydrogenase-like protein